MCSIFCSMFFIFCYQDDIIFNELESNIFCEHYHRVNILKMYIYVYLCVYLCMFAC